MNKILHTIIHLLLFSSLLYGQDPHFTQFYANPLYLAPSFAGATEQHRGAVSFRDQWPGFPGAFVSFTGSYDYYFSNFNSGVGILFTRDQAGSGRLRNTGVTLQYSYDFNVTKGWHLRPGIGFTYAMWGLDFNKLIFPDQLYSGMGEPKGTTSTETPPSTGMFSGDIDAAVSLLIYQERFWTGGCIDHLLKPDQAMFGVPSVIPMKFTLFGGYQLVKMARLLKPVDETISFAYLFRSQGQYKQLDLGLYWYHYPLVLGAWYRGIPPYNGPRGDAIAFLVGLKVDGLNIGYSYDFTVSKLIGDSHGAHEITMIYQFKTRPVKKWHAIPCPDF